MSQWTQNYIPINNSLFWSAVVAAVPIMVFMLSLAVLRLRGHISALLAVVLALIVAVVAYQMPIRMALAAAAYGFLYGLWPFAWIVIGTVFLFKVVVRSGQFESIRSSVVRITADPRLQMVLIGFAFGAFLEGAAGFGTPVAITSALLVGLGFNPVYAAGLCLIANTAPVAFGALGLPVLVAAKVSGTDAGLLAKMVGRQLPFLSVLVPFWLVAVMDGWRGIRDTWKAISVAGGSFALTQFLTSNFIGPELPDIASSIVCLFVTTLYLRRQARPVGQSIANAIDWINALKAWSPFLILTAVVTMWTLPAVKPWMNAFTLSFAIPGLHNHVIQSSPIVTTPTPYEAIFQWNILGATGTAILVTTLVTMFLLRQSASDGVELFAETLRELRWPILTIGLVLALAFVANYSGISSTLGLAFAASGAMFPVFSPFLGWLGVFLTGSDTASNALFGNLQRVTGEQLGINPLLTVAANTTGGVTGKMISPQSIAVVCAATQQVGREADLFRFTLKHSLVFAAIIGLITFLQASYLSMMIPMP